MARSGVSRRDVLRFGAALPLLSGLPNLGLGASGRHPGHTAKNIIVCISDGMSAGVPAMLDQYLHRVHGKRSTWGKLQERADVEHGALVTKSLSSVVTDSAAASSAWGSGCLVWNGQLNTYPDGTELRPLYSLLKEAGMRTGLVSTATITHATPAGFAISEMSRDSEQNIAAKYVTAEVDVYMGGGRRFFRADARTDKRDLIAEFKAAGYGYASDRASLMAQKGGKILGLFSESHVPYEVDRLNDEEFKDLPSLREMTEVAINALKGSSGGFILQIEGARIDHAAHGNDLAGALYDQMAFEEAVAAALEFAENDGETLLIVTSDHANSNPGILGAGSEYFDSTAGLETLTGMTKSYERTLPGLVLAKDNPAKIKETVEAALGIAMDDDELALFQAGLKGEGHLSKVYQYQIAACHLSLAISNHTHVAWSGRQHTNDYTIVSAFGPGAEAFRGLTHNKAWFGEILAHRDITYRNKQMDFETAQAAHARASLSIEPAHWA